MSFAPANNPKIAIAVIIENGGHGGSVAAPIAGKVIEAYLSQFTDQQLRSSGKKQAQKLTRKKPEDKTMDHNHD